MRLPALVTVFVIRDPRIATSTNPSLNKVAELCWENSRIAGALFKGLWLPWSNDKSHTSVR
jgi:hypothetical protein